MVSVRPATDMERSVLAYRLRAWWPAGLLVALMALAYATGLHRQISLTAVADNRDALKQFVSDHWFLALAAYAAVYVAITVAALPAAAAISIAGGFLFGWLVSAPLSAASATLGASIAFRIVRTTAGRALAAKAGPVLARLQKGFAEDAFHYLLALRLMPVVPFFIVNVVAGLSQVRTATFVAATGLGIIPGALAYAWLGTGLDSIIAAQRQAYEACRAANTASPCRFVLEPSALLTPQLVAAFFGLAVIALLPLLLRRVWRTPME